MKGVNVKRIILLISSILLLTGCSVNAVYDFSGDSISSNIDVKFDVNDFIIYENKVWGEEADYDLSANNMIDQMYNDSNVNAVIDSNKIYNKILHKKEEYNHQFLYNYNFSYKDFENNYIFKNCFDHFITIEKDDNYYYYLTGNFKCIFDKNIYLKIKGNKVYDSNSTNVKNGVHTWNIKEKDNDISFVISKNVIDKPLISKKNHTIDIIMIVIVCLLALVTFILLKRVKNNN